MISNTARGFLAVVLLFGGIGSMLGAFMLGDVARYVVAFFGTLMTVAGLGALYIESFVAWRVPDRQTSGREQGIGPGLVAVFAFLFLDVLVVGMDHAPVEPVPPMMGVLLGGPAFLIGIVALVMTRERARLDPRSNGARVLGTAYMLLGGALVLPTAFDGGSLASRFFHPIALVGWVFIVLGTVTFLRGLQRPWRDPYGERPARNP